MNERIPNDMNSRPGPNPGVFLIAALLLVIIGFFIFHSFSQSKEYLTDAEMTAYLREQVVKEIVISPLDVGDATSGEATVSLEINNVLRTRYYFISDVAAFRAEIAATYPNVKTMTEPLEEPSIWMEVLPYALLMIVGIILVMFLMSRVGGGGAQMNNFGKSGARMSTKKEHTITFADVAGSKEEKEEMREIVEFLANPTRFKKLGARIPKGILLVGSPGTGKTYLARAVAGEAGVPFFTISGSDFVEMFVGVGASRVRDLFDNAKKHAPCIVFIDEIDAVGRRRGAGLGGSHDEREQTLNQLLVEMDGFTPNSGVIVMAATNRVDILDPALLRPGRFDRRIVVHYPDFDGRMEVLNLYAKNKPLSADVDLESIARLTVGFTPADLENLLNEAAIWAGREKRSFITKIDLQEAFVRVGVGTEKKSRRMTEHEREITAYHEIGHAIMHSVLPELDPVHLVSIIPTGLAGGYTMSLPPEDRMYVTKNELKAEMAGLLGGRAAESIVFGDVTSGASNDLERTSEIARSMVTKYGMSDTLGPIQFGEQDEEIFLGKEIGHTRNYGEDVANAIDLEVHQLVEEAMARTRATLVQYRGVLDAGAKLLLEKEKISGKELEDLIAEVGADA